MPFERYQDCGGAFYQQTAQGYQVVVPPSGLTVTSIPNGATMKNVGGNSYLEYGGVWYRPFYSGSDVVYQVVNDPGA